MDYLEFVAKNARSEFSTTIELERAALIEALRNCCIELDDVLNGEGRIDTESIDLRLTDSRDLLDKIGTPYL